MALERSCPTYSESSSGFGPRVEGLAVSLARLWPGQAQRPPCAQLSTLVVLQRALSPLPLCLAHSPLLEAIPGLSSKKPPLPSEFPLPVCPSASLSPLGINHCLSSRR